MATFVSAEKQFSKAGNIIEKTGNKHKPGILHKMLFLNNYKSSE